MRGDVDRASIEEVARVLNEAAVPFILVGGVAVVAHGYRRFTNDIDLVIRLQADIIKRAFPALALAGYRPTVPVTAAAFGDANQRARWMSEKGMKVLNFYSDQHRTTPLAVFISEPFDFQTEYRAAKVEEIAPGLEVRVVSLPTLLRLKREAGRPQDLADIFELEKINQKDSYA